MVAKGFNAKGFSAKNCHCEEAKEFQAMGKFVKGFTEVYLIKSRD